jgi:hypothetical protein
MTIYPQYPPFSGESAFRIVQYKMILNGGSISNTGRYVKIASQAVVTWFRSARQSREHRAKRADFSNRRKLVSAILPGGKDLIGEGKNVFPGSVVVGIVCGPFADAATDRSSVLDVVPVNSADAQPEGSPSSGPKLRRQ